MAHKGKFKKPIHPLSVAVERAIEFIDQNSNGCALFMVAGKITSSSRSSSHFEHRVKTLCSNLIGVYDQGIDVRQLREDIGIFYSKYDPQYGAPLNRPADAFAYANAVVERNLATAMIDPLSNINKDNGS